MNKLTLERKLSKEIVVKMSSSCIEYVVVHELAHISHKNHSSDFWGLVKRHLRDYKVTEEKIKGFERVI